MEDDLSALVEIIGRGISCRGYFLMVDQCADQICGERFEPNNLTHIGAIHMLAARHGWQAVVAGRVINFAAETPSHFSKLSDSNQ
jgi:hypothetical protein